VQSGALVELLYMTPTVLELASLDVSGYVQGKSLMPILRGDASPDFHREFVRCEYFDAIDAGMANRLLGPLGAEQTGGGRGPGAEEYQPIPGTWATMYRDERYKLVVYHGHGLGSCTISRTTCGSSRTCGTTPAPRGSRAT
jgi:hypothetical protein